MPPAEQPVEDRHAVAAPAQERKRQEDQKPQLEHGHEGVTARRSCTKKWVAWMTRIVMLGSGKSEVVEDRLELGHDIIEDEAADSLHRQHQHQNVGKP